MNIDNVHILIILYIRKKQCLYCIIGFPLRCACFIFLHLEQFWKKNHAACPFLPIKNKMKTPHPAWPFLLRPAKLGINFTWPNTSFFITNEFRFFSICLQNSSLCVFVKYWISDDSSNIYQPGYVSLIDWLIKCLFICLFFCALF